MSLVRHSTVSVKVGNLFVGSQHPVVVQSMTNTDTEDALATAKQIEELHKAGSEMVRITVNTVKAAQNVEKIKNYLALNNVDVPIVGDFHFNGHKLFQQVPECAALLDKYRINPGNVGKGKKRDEQFAQMIEKAIEHNKPVRIGVNWGSLDQTLLAKLLDDNKRLSQPLSLNEINRQAVIQSALESAQQAMDIGLAKEQIILSCKMSGVQDLISVYENLAKQSDFALHLGLTEAGMGIKGTVASTAALSVLLQQGIGDTIRISLTPKPGEARTTEVLVAQEILQSLNIRSFTPQVASCPGCGRTSSDYFQKLAEQIQSFLRESMPEWKSKFPGVEDMSVAVMGCVVNGPGESKHANIGISLPGNGEKPVAPVYEDGEKTVTLKGDNIAVEFQARVFAYIKTHY